MSSFAVRMRFFLQIMSINAAMSSDERPFGTQRRFLIDYQINLMVSIKIVEAFRGIDECL